MILRSAILNVMTAAATKAGKAILRDFGELDKLQVSRKGTADFATNADKRSEKIIFQELKKARPDYGFLMEESGEVPAENGSEFRFVIDPIDGTHNFIHAVPYFCIAIAMEKKLANGSFETQAAVIYDPIQNEMFCAELYQGATMNGQRIVTSGRSELDTCMVTTFMPHQHAESRQNKLHAAISSFPFSLRVTGSTALDLAYIAAGRYDAGCWISYKHWDIAAGKLLIREAGGTILEQDDPNKLLFVSNAHIHTKCVSSLRGL